MKQGRWSIGGKEVVTPPFFGKFHRGILQLQIPKII